MEYLSAFGNVPHFFHFRNVCFRIKCSRVYAKLFQKFTLSLTSLTCVANLNIQKSLGKSVGKSVNMSIFGPGAKRIQLKNNDKNKTQSTRSSLHGIVLPILGSQLILHRLN